MILTRAEIEREIERLVEMLDQMDGDPDFEEDGPEEQHDAEADLTWRDGHAPVFYVVAQRARRKAQRR